MNTVFNDPQTVFTKIGYDPDKPATAFMNKIFILSILSLIAGIALFIVFGKKLSESCTKCGRPFILGKRSTAEGANFCTQCQHIYVKQDGVLPERRSAKLLAGVSPQKPQGPVLPETLSAPLGDLNSPVRRRSVEILTPS